MTIKSRTKQCAHCGGEFRERCGASDAQWERQKYCSYVCLNRSKTYPGPEPIEKAFWRKAVIGKHDECWDWTGSKNQKGRSRLKVDGRMVSAGRVALFLRSGEWPSQEMSILHTCDNPGCVNPGHLFVGTQRDNVLDMIRKGRANPVSGERSPKSKLTEEQVRSIRSKLASGETAASISRSVGISRSVVRKIATGELWKCVQ